MSANSVAIVTLKFHKTNKQRANRWKHLVNTGNILVDQPRSACVRLKNTSVTRRKSRTAPEKAPNQ